MDVVGSRETTGKHLRAATGRSVRETQRENSAIERPGDIKTLYMLIQRHARDPHTLIVKLRITTKAKDREKDRDTVAKAYNI